MTHSTLDSRVPEGTLTEKWSRHRFALALVNPANKRHYSIIVVGSGLAGAAAAATLGELGYRVASFCIQDSPRRAHSIAAQGGINAAKNYANDGDSVYRLFYDTIKGGDYRAREANVYRLAELSNAIIDQCVAQGVPFAREYGGLLANRSFGGAQVSRAFYARGQTGQQLLLGAYGALSRQVGAGNVALHPRHEMLDLIVIDGAARGIVTRDLVSGKLHCHVADAVVLATGGYGNLYYLSTNAKASNVTATWRAHKRGALFANPCFVQIHPTCIPVSGAHQSKLTLMSESLRNDGRVWVPAQAGDARPPAQIPEAERSYFLEERYPAFGNLVPRDVASRAAKETCDRGLGVGGTGQAVYLDLRDAIARLGRAGVAQRYGNVLQMYEQITGEDGYDTPLRIYPAVHYTMGGLWVDYNLMSTIPGLFVIGEANYSDHGANRLGASALMQGLADGYFILPHTLGAYLAESSLPRVSVDHPACRDAEREARERTQRLMGGGGGGGGAGRAGGGRGRSSERDRAGGSDEPGRSGERNRAGGSDEPGRSGERNRAGGAGGIRGDSGGGVRDGDLRSGAGSSRSRGRGTGGGRAGSRGQTVDYFHRELGRCMWDHCGMARTASRLREAAAKVAELRDRFWREVNVPGASGDLNQPLERAGRVADFLEFADLMIQDALDRRESCGSHFREEYQTAAGEPLRNDADYAYVAAWEHRGVGQPARLHREPLVFEQVHPTARVYR